MPESQFNRDLIEWYRANKRDLPWRRRHHDPYAVWISEIMLQQTTVSAALSFYERWMERFPDVFTLAAAPLNDVLDCWSGLGYYARARNLHKTANILVERHKGQMPRDLPEIIELPGIGPYTAGAILSIAYNQEQPIVDANVKRVLSRIYAIRANPTSNSESVSHLWKIAERLIPRGNASDFNQAMMELGALICEPAPRCGTCPVVAHCNGYKTGRPEDYPRPSKSRSWLKENHVSLAMVNPEGEVLILKRPESEPLWGGLWELPRVICEPGESAQDAARRIAITVSFRGMDISRCISPIKQFGIVKHVVANRKIQLHGFIINDTGNYDAPDGYSETAWVAGIRNIPMASPQKRLFALLADSIIQPALELFD